MALEGVRFVPYKETLDLLSVEQAMQVCEDVYRMHAAGSVQWSQPSSWKLTWGALSQSLACQRGDAQDIPVTGVRMV